MNKNVEKTIIRVLNGKFKLIVYNPDSQTLIGNTKNICTEGVSISTISFREFCQLILFLKKLGWQLPDEPSEFEKNSNTIILIR